MYFHFWFRIFSWYFYGNCEFQNWIKTGSITVGIKKYKSIIKEKKKKPDKIVLLGKSKLNSIAVSISKALIDSKISHDEFILINKLLKEFYDMKREIKNSNNK